jgi:hydrogenase nickel incorporation protein HypA/HybF
MHELSLTQSLIEIVEDYARKEGFSRVNVLKLSFGRLAGIDSGALAFAFETQSQGTKAEGARLEFDIRPAVLYCMACERESPSAGDGFRPLCPLCGGSEVILAGGTEELKLLEMDVD